MLLAGAGIVAILTFMNRGYDNLITYVSVLVAGSLALYLLSGYTSVEVVSISTKILIKMQRMTTEKIIEFIELIENTKEQRMSALSQEFEYHD